MFPNLFHLGPQMPVTTYGALLAIAFLVGIWLASRQTRREGRSPDPVIDLSFWILVSSLIGSQVLYIFTRSEDYYNACFHPASPQMRDCLLAFKFWRGGLVFYGGFLGATFASWWYMRRHKMNFLQTADAIFPSVPLGHFFGRLGCFSAGCCYGKLVHGDWGARFPPDSMAYSALARFGGGERTPPLHPTQLYEALGELLIFLGLLFVRRSKRFHGQVLLSWLVAYPILRTIVEMFRGDDIRGYVARLPSPDLARALGLNPAEPLFLSTSQFMSLLVALATAVTVVVLRTRAAKRSAVGATA